MSIAACAAVVERADPDRFLATMAAPVAAREVLFPLYAFNVEVTRAPWVSREEMVCEIRLQWWHDLLGEIEDGAAPRAHEVAAPLAAVVRARAVPVAPLRALVAARRQDIYRDPFADDAAFAAYIEETAAGLMWAAARALGAPEASEPAVRAIGWAAGLAAFFRAVPELAARGRRPLPDASPEAIAALAREALDRLAAARKRGIPAAALPAVRAGWRAPETLSRAATDPGCVAAGRLEEGGLTRRAALLRRVALGGW